MTLAPPDMEDRIFLPVRGAPARGGTAALSAMAHIAALGLLLTVATQVPPAPPDVPAIPLVFRAPSASLSPAPAQTTIPLASAQLAGPAPQAAPIAMAVAPLAAFHIARARPTPKTSTASQPPATPHRSVALLSPATAQSTPHATPQTSNAEAPRIEIAQFTGSIHAAVQAATLMPTAARRQHREGRAQVRFSYLDGAVAEIVLAQSSQSRVLDDAALAAVARARYPAPPVPLRGHKIPMVLWVEFQMAAASADS